MRSMIGVTLAALAGCAWFEGGPSTEGRTKVGYLPFEVEGSDRAPEGALDPVSGDWVAPDTDYVTAYAGLTYFFASKENLQAFQQRPQFFVTDDGYLQRPLDEVRREAEAK